MGGPNNFNGGIGGLRPCEEGHVTLRDVQRLLVVARSDELTASIIPHFKFGSSTRKQVISHRTDIAFPSLSLRHLLVTIQHDV